MKGISVLLTLLVVAGSELARAPEECEDDSQFPTERSLLIRRTKRSKPPRRTTTETFHTDTTIDITTHATKSSYTDLTTPTPFPTTTDTSSTSSTTPASYCSDTRFSVHDLKDLIKFTANELHVLESIKESYYSDATNLRDTLNNTLTTFSKWFVDQPAHLKHILDDISQSRKRIELNISQINKDLEENAKSLEDFHKLQLQVASLEELTNKTKVVCEYTCRPQPVSRYLKYDVVKDVTAEGYYCGKLADIHEKIKASLIKFTNDTQESLKTHIKENNGTYSQKIDQLKNKLKDIALKQFGYTMYDILRLIDLYHHLEEKANIDEVHDMVNQNKDIIDNITSKVWKLKDLNKQIFAKCKQCRNYFAIGSQFVPNQNKDEDMLEKLLDKHKENITQNIMDDYNNIFDGLEKDLNLDNPEIVDKYIENLKKIQDEVTDMALNENETYKILSSQFPSEVLEDQGLIKDEAKKLLKSLDDIKNKLDALENIIHY